MIKKKKPTGRSFPFIERKDGSLKLKYNEIQFEYEDDQAVITFIQDDIEIFAWTFNTEPGGAVNIHGLEGTIDINLETY